MGKIAEFMDFYKKDHCLNINVDFEKLDAFEAECIMMDIEIETSWIFNANQHLLRFRLNGRKIMCNIFFYDHKVSDKENHLYFNTRNNLREDIALDVNDAFEYIRDFLFKRESE